jgi:hypothetical protein
MNIHSASLNIALLLLLLLCSAAIAYANNSLVLSGYQTVGNGKLTWWGMTVYHATLYSVNGRYHPNHEYALQIDYRINVSAQRLAEISLEQIEKIYGPQPEREAMIQSLAEVFCDVDKGDSIIGNNKPRQGAQFYCNGQLIGEIDNPKLAEAFFAIWLHPDTREPELRAQLIGITTE